MRKYLPAVLVCLLLGTGCANPPEPQSADAPQTTTNSSSAQPTPTTSAEPKITELVITDAVTARVELSSAGDDWLCAGVFSQSEEAAVVEASAPLDVVDGKGSCLLGVPKSELVPGNWQLLVNITDSQGESVVNAVATVDFVI